MLTPAPGKVSPGDMEAARGHLNALLGQVTLQPEAGELRAYLALNAKGLTEASPLHIKVVAGAGFDQIPYLFTCRLPLVA